MLALQKPELETGLRQAAANQKITAEELLHHAVSEYLKKAAEQKIKTENLAFKKLHARLMTKYSGDYVAVHNGKVVDHDKDARALHLRIRKQFGQIPVLLRQVTYTPEQPELLFRSPKLEIL